MAGVSILMILSFMLFFTLTREAMVKIIKLDRLRIEIHLQLFAYIWTKKDKNDNADTEKQRKKCQRFRILTKS